MPTENTTSNQGYQLPFGDNDLSVDVARIISAITAIDNDIASALASLAAKAGLLSPAFTGTPTAPTAAPGTDTGQLATTAFVKAAVDALIGGAPGALDTLNELAAALGDNADYAASIVAALALKADQATTYTKDEVDTALGDKADADALAALEADQVHMARVDETIYSAPQILQFRENFGLTGYEHLGRVAFTAASIVDIGDVSAYRGLRISGSLTTIGTAYLGLQLSEDGVTWAVTEYRLTSTENSNGSLTGALVANYTLFPIGPRYSGTNGSWLNGTTEVSNLKSEHGLPVIAESIGLLRQTDGGNYHCTYSAYMNGGGVYEFARLASVGGTVTGAVNVWGIR